MLEQVPPLPLRWIFLSAATLLQRSSAHGLSRLDAADALVEPIDDAQHRPHFGCPQEKP